MDQATNEWSGGWRPLLGGLLAMSAAWNVVDIALSVFLGSLGTAIGVLSIGA